jgi:hypothetical protein
MNRRAPQASENLKTKQSAADPMLQSLEHYGSAANFDPKYVGKV